MTGFNQAGVGFNQAGVGFNGAVAETTSVTAAELLPALTETLEAAVLVTVAAGDTLPALGEALDLARDATRVTAGGLPDGLVLDGTGDSASTPDSPTLSVTGDIDLRCAITPDDWTPTNGDGLVAKWRSSGNQRSYRLILTSGGNLQLVHSADGAASIAMTSTVATGTSDGTSLLTRATLDVDDGAGNRVATFYTKALVVGNLLAQLTDSTGWTQLGATVTTAGTTSIFDGTSPCVLGQNGDDAGNVAGTFLAAVIYDGIDGTLVASPDFSPTGVPTADPNASTYTDAQGNIWTLNGDAHIASAGAEVLPALGEALDLARDATRLTAGEDLPPLTEALTGERDATTVTAADALPALGEATTLTATVAITGSEQLPALTDAATIDLTVTVLAGDTLPPLTEVLAAERDATRLAAGDDLPPLTEALEVARDATTVTGTDALPALGEALDLARAATALTATEALPALTETVSLFVGSGVAITAAEQLPALGEALELERAGTTVTSTEDLPALGEALLAAALIALTAAETLPTLGDQAVLGVVVALAGTELLPALGETLTATATTRLTATEDLPPLTEAATAERDATRLAAGDVLPALGETLTADRDPTQLTAGDLLPALGEALLVAAGIVGRARPPFTSSLTARDHLSSLEVRAP